jgi:hypothetical protein
MISGAEFLTDSGLGMNGAVVATGIWDGLSLEVGFERVGCYGC